MTDLVRIGSETARGGFANERDIAHKFDNWKADKEAQKWLQILGYNLKKIKKVKAIILHGHKTDVQVQVIVMTEDAISTQNISIKKTNDDADYNQVDKRWVKRYAEMWDIPENIAYLLRLFSGEISPAKLLKNKKITKTKYNSLRDKRRFFLNEFDKKDKVKIVNFFNKNKFLILADIIKGNDEFPAQWMLVTKYNTEDDETTWILVDINKAINVFGQGAVAEYCEPFTRIENFNLMASYSDKVNFLRWMTQVPKKSAKMGKGAVLPNLVLVADIISNATSYRGMGSEDNKPKKTLTQKEKNTLAFTNATRHYYPYNANLTLRDYNSEHISGLGCNLDSLCKDIPTFHQFFVLYPHHRYEVCATHDVFSYYALIKEERALIKAGQFRAFLQTSYYAPKTLKRLFKLNLASTNLRTF